MLQIIVGAALRTAARSALKEGAEQLIKRSAKRAAALEKAGVVTNDVKKLRDLQAKVTNNGGLGKLTRNELVSVYKQVSKLDQSKGTRSASARQVYVKEQQAKRRRDLVKRLNDPASASKMSTDELKEAYGYQVKLMRDQARRTEKAVGETHATRKFHEAQADFGSVKDKTRNQLLSQTNKLSRIGSYEGMTPSGARKQMDRGERWFGSSWKNYTPEEQGAIWDEIKKYQSAHQVRSDVAIYTFREMMDKMGDHGVARAKFDRDPNTGKIRGVDFGFTMSDAETEQAKKAANRKARQRILDNSKKLLLKW